LQNFRQQILAAGGQQIFQLKFFVLLRILSFRGHGNDGLVWVLAIQSNLAMAFLFLLTYSLLQKLLYTATSAELCTKFDSLFENSDAVKEKLKSRSSLCVKLMDEQWDYIAKIITG